MILNERSQLRREVKLGKKKPGITSLFVILIGGASNMGADTWNRAFCAQSMWH